ncbi:MAG: FtsQ-type POTRA domain-containing protein [Pseudomonadales bacterium]|nr:FtsQ-type POTRA domain-containing protein [Pseudomonadales bacterium]
MVGGLYRLLILTLFVLIALFVYDHRAVVNDFFNQPVAAISVGGDTNNIDRSKLQLVLSSMAKQRFFELDVDGIARRIRQMPWVQDVQVRKQWPDRISVTLTERVPVARWGTNALVDEYGQVFSVDGRLDKFSSLPILQSAEQQDSALVKKFQMIFEKFNRSNLKIERMIRTKADSWSIKLVDGPMVILGKQQFDLRVARFFVLWKTLKPEQIKRISTMDFRYSNGVAVSKRRDQKYAHGVYR